MIGTHPDMIDMAEDRKKFSEMLDTIGVDQAPWRELVGPESCMQFAKEVPNTVLSNMCFLFSSSLSPCVWIFLEFRVDLVFLTSALTDTCIELTILCLFLPPR